MDHPGKKPIEDVAANSPTNYTTCDATAATDDMVVISKKLAKVRDRMKNNISFIRAKTQERDKLNELIQKKTRENVSLGQEVVSLLNDHEARMNKARENYENISAKLEEEHKNAEVLREKAEEFGSRFNNMSHFRDDYLMLPRDKREAAATGEDTQTMATPNAADGRTTKAEKLKGKAKGKSYKDSSQDDVLLKATAEVDATK